MDMLHFQIGGFGNFIHNINWLDVMLGLIMLLGMARGLWTGFSRAISTLLGVVLGFWVAINYFPVLSLHLSPLVRDPLWQPLISFFLLFLFVYLLFVLGGILIQGFLKALSLSWLDRVMGGLVGLAKGLVLSGVIVFLLTVFLPKESPVLKHSLLYPQISKVARLMGSLVPQELKGRFMWKWRRIVPQPERPVRKEAV